MALHPPKIGKQFVDDVYSIFKRAHLDNFFHDIFQVYYGEKSYEELAFLHTLLKLNNGKNSVMVYRKPMPINQYLNYSSHSQTSCKEDVVSSLLNRAYSIITTKMT